MTELLAPAGSMEALKVAIANGCDAVYLGAQKFGARAYASNFDQETLQEAVNYAHLRNVKIYVTMNTIIFQDEIEEMKKQVDILNSIGVDGIIVQDLAAFEYIEKYFPGIEVHCSTQMGIDDLEGTLLCKELGAKRVVLSREVPIEKVKEIRKQAKIPIEIFVHGALCISYSGNCLMSGLMGYRSGNRGRCVGSCRKVYELSDTTNNVSLAKNYILSTKDLNTIDYINDLEGIDSLKIEGRMKEPAYVANVIGQYRKALDHKITKEDKENLKKTFNRTFTKGYLFHEDKKHITNTRRPNNVGYEIGKISKRLKDRYEISLIHTLNQNDVIRIDHDNEDVNLTVAKLYDEAGNLIKSAQKTCYIKVKEKLSVGDRVYISKDYEYYKVLESSGDKEFRHFPLDIKVYAYPEAKLIVEAEGLGLSYVYESEELLGEAINNPTTKEQIVKQFSKLKETVFTLNEVTFEGWNAFIPVKLLNTARREVVQGLYERKISGHYKEKKAQVERDKISFPTQQPYITATVITKEQYETCIQSGIKDVYFENIIRRNQNEYKDIEGELLIGGYGGIYHYQSTNEFVTDYSLNVVNAESCYQLYKLGAKRVTLSYELNKTQIEALVDAYYKENEGYPSLEMVVYGKAPLMFTKYCPMKEMNECGKCKNRNYVLKDEQGIFPIISHEDCTTTLLNGKNLNLLDELKNIKGVEAYRLNFTTESQEEVEEIISVANDKLNGVAREVSFNQITDTRGHFNKEIL